MIFPQFSEVFYHTESTYQVYKPSEFDPTEPSLHLFTPYRRFCGVRWTPLWLIVGVPHLFSIDDSLSDLLSL